MYKIGFLTYKEEWRQFIRFIVVGGMATAIHYLIYIGLEYCGLNTNMSYTLGYGISFVFNYIASNYFTFKVKANIESGIKFIGAHLCNYLLQLILLNILIYYNVSKLIAPILVFMISVPTNFIMVRFALNKKKS